MTVGLLTVGFINNHHQLAWRAVEIAAQRLNGISGRDVSRHAGDARHRRTREARFGAHVIDRYAATLAESFVVEQLLEEDAYQVVSL